MEFDEELNERTKQNIVDAVLRIHELERAIQMDCFFMNFHPPEYDFEILPEMIIDERRKIEVNQGIRRLMGFDVF